MLSNSLTRDMGLKVGPVMLGTFVKHYFDRVKARESADPDTLLRQDEILYDEAFNIIKASELLPSPTLGRDSLTSTYSRSFMRPHCKRA